MGVRYLPYIYISAAGKSATAWNLKFHNAQIEIAQFIDIMAATDLKGDVAKALKR